MNSIFENKSNLDKKVSVYTMGCRLNFSETGTIAKGFHERGYKIVDFEVPADVVFINTCTVTDGADSSCRNLIRKAQKYSPEAKIVVAGCYAQMEAENIKKMKGVDLILGTSEKYKVFDYLEDDKNEIIHIDKTNSFYKASTSLEEGHTRAFLKIQDGCNYICSFCIIPKARGRSRAISIDEAVTEARSLINNGFKEIVLTGVNIGEYEQSSGEKLIDLVSRLLELDGLERFRLSSVEPNTMSKELIDLLRASDKFLPHFHIPLQSGNDEILTEMRRKYSVSKYKEIIGHIIELFPNAGIGADVIVGFPGETPKQFQDTKNLLSELPITHFHVFPYSKRKGTIAAIREDHLQHHIKKDRVKELLNLGEKKLRDFALDQIGGTSSVLFERKNNNDLWEGYTENFVRVFVESDLDLKNKIQNVQNIKAENGILYSKLI